MKLTKKEYELLSFLKEKKRVSFDEIEKKTGYDQSFIYATLKELEEKGVLTIEEERKRVIVLKEKGKKLLNRALPERTLLESFKKDKELFKNLREKMDEESFQQALRWGFKKKLWIKEKEYLKLTEEGKKYKNEKMEDERILEVLTGRKEVKTEELADFDYEKGVKFLKTRNAVDIKERVKREVEVKKDLELITKPGDVITQLTPEIISSGKWKEAVFKKYDVKIPGEVVYPGKPHPLRKIIDEARRVFLEMGFKEIYSGHVETGFWDFDALFQPQDHPAREMQDTFYVKNPEYGSIPEGEWVERVKKTHEDGWTTGSTGWNYEWSEKEAKRIILRTHTTATTIRYLAKNPKPPQKVFIVGKVFRREKVTYKHLPEFMQIDGIVIDEGANFASLLGILKEFYRKMGFEEIRFRPAFFPYTEPSLEVYVRFEKKEWIELGGAGIFRPEVTLPFECNVPVLAWGLGLERLAMLRFGLNDIRKLYWADFDWLRRSPLCR